MTSPLSYAGVGAPIRSPLFDYVMETAGGGEPWQHGPGESSVAFFHLGNLAWPLTTGLWLLRKESSFGRARDTCKVVKKDF